MQSTKQEKTYFIAEQEARGFDPESSFDEGAYTEDLIMRSRWG